MVRYRWAAALVAAMVITSGCAWVGRVGVATDGTQPGGGNTVGTDVSPNGRFVVFTSEANNLVPNDTNNAADVFLRDVQTGTTERVSVADNEAEANLGGYGGIVSADGRYVAFSSDSDNLLSTPDTNSATDVFLRDRQAGTTIRVSVRSGGGEADGASTLSSMTRDAKQIVFASDADDLIGLNADQNFSTDVFVRDRPNARTVRLSVATDGSEGDLDSTGGSISADGRYVVFLSNASTFDPNDSGVYQDAYVRDRTLNTTTRVTAFADGSEGDSDVTNAVISADGSTVVFDTDATNFIDPPDLSGATNVYAVPLGSHTFERMSVAADGGDPSDFSFLTGVSDDGRFVLFQSGAKNLTGDKLTAVSNSFVRDRTNHSTVFAGTTQSMTEPIGPDAQRSGSTPNAISGNGRYILYSSNATDVIGTGDANDSVADVFLRSNPAPFILFAQPATIARGATGTIALKGSGLNGSGALVLMGDGVAVNSVTTVSESELDVTVTVSPSAAPGPRMPVVVQKGTNSSSAFTGGIVFLPNAFSVT
jgi:Tol biopolymer transport system component